MGAGCERRWKVLAGAAVCFVAISAAGCTRSDSGDPATGAAFVEEDLSSIVLTPVDAPEGTTYSSAVSGFQDLDAFARDAEEKVALQDDDFVVAHLALFAPDGHAEPGQGPPLPPDAPFGQGITALFETPQGASSALGRFLTDLRTRQLSEPTDVEPLGFGEEASGVEGDARGSHVVAFAWRDGNLLLVTIGAGRISEASVRALAQSVQDRAAAVA